jgi:hypothetical protein
MVSGTDSGVHEARDIQGLHDDERQTKKKKQKKISRSVSKRRPAPHKSRAPCDDATCKVQRERGSGLHRVRETWAFVAME